LWSTIAEHVTGIATPYDVVSGGMRG
jgi:hypothetical protein